MPINMIKDSGNAKTGPIAVTYRSGYQNPFGTCPTSCALNPNKIDSATRVDTDYLGALLEAVPRRGVAFTYSHFHWRKWFRKMSARLAEKLPTTTINYSADTIKQSAAAVAANVPTVLALAESALKHPKTWRESKTRFVVCPATYSDLTCSDCGGRDMPLCARPDRQFVIVFPAHGASRNRVGTSDDGGCYAAGGNVRLHWNALARRAAATVSDGRALLAWVRKLPTGKTVRHHVTGDIGKC